MFLKLGRLQAGNPNKNQIVKCFNKNGGMDQVSCYGCDFTAQCKRINKVKQ